jgi:hypothetical protein
MVLLTFVKNYCMHKMAIKTSMDNIDGKYMCYLDQSAVENESRRIPRGSV